METCGDDVAGAIEPADSDEPSCVCWTSDDGGESVEELLAAVVPGWVARASPKTARKLPAAVRATVRFARAALLRPAAILELSCMPPS